MVGVQYVTAHVLLVSITTKGRTMTELERALTILFQMYEFNQMGHLGPASHISDAVRMAYLAGFDDGLYNDPFANSDNGIEEFVALLNERVQGFIDRKNDGI